MTDEEINAIAAERFRELDRYEEAGERAGQLKDWAWSVLCWDGVLPIVVIGIPIVVQWMAPNGQILLAPMFGLLPVVALCVRFVFGWNRMRRGEAYVWQMVFFTVAISALFLFEMFILNDQIAKGPKIADPQVLATMFAVYLSMMAIALFPLRKLPMKRFDDSAQDDAAL
ncbi:MAG: hypothetical protein U0805_04815 [Pirellulales bacterium]